MRHVSLAGMPCPIARSLDLVGEWWSLLIVRDALFGARRFDDFKTIGIADNVLAARLKRLVEVGILERRRYRERPNRYEYMLTEKGRELGPVLSALRQWGTLWTTGQDQNPRLLHSACHHEIAVGVVCRSSGRLLEWHELVQSNVSSRDTDS